MEIFYRKDEFLKAVEYIDGKLVKTGEISNSEINPIQNQEETLAKTSKISHYTGLAVAQGKLKKELQDGWGNIRKKIKSYCIHEN